MPNDSMDQRQFARAESMRVASASESREAISLQEAVSRQGPSRCPACRESHIARGRYNLASCHGCRHVFQSDLHVSMVYDADYAHQYDHRPHEAMSRIRWEFIQQHLRLPQGSKVLDIGYGNGAFLKLAQREGMDIYGIDLHGEDFGVPEVDYDTTIDFDLICFFDSIEHLPEFDLIFGLNAGNVVVSIPDPPDFLLSTPNLWRHYKPGEHLHYFSRGSLDTVLTRWGLPKKLAEGHPEDALRGKLDILGRSYDNIYTAIYSRGHLASAD